MEERDLSTIVTIPKLTLGTFFTLLNIGKMSNATGFAQETLLFELMRVINPGLHYPGHNTIKSQTSGFKSCDIDYADWIPLNSLNFVKEVSDKMDTEYSEMLKRTSEWLHSYFDFEDDYKLNKTCKAVLDVISKDTSISDNALFYVESSKIPIEKQHLLEKNFYKIEPFLLGVFVYVLTHRENKNTSGKPTINSWSFPNGLSKNTEYYYEFGEGSKAASIDFISLSNQDLENIADDLKNVEFKTSYNVDGYLDFLKEKYCEVKPIFRNSPRPFYDQFVPSRIKYEDSQKEEKPIINPTAKSLKDTVSNFIIMVGSGGLGKTMMMHHFLLESVNNYKEKHMVPFFVKLKDYNNEGEKDLETLIVLSINQDHPVSREEFREIMKSGNGLVLLDGLDEIKSSYLRIFAKNVENLTDSYPKSMFIISTRDYDNFDAYPRFTVTELMPLTETQSIELVNNIEPSKTVRDVFTKNLKSGKYKKYNHFISNPMMLTIFLTVLKDQADIPLHISSFFSRAYNVLASKHDTDKELYIRPLSTDLNPDEFRELLTRFCSLVYLTCDTQTFTLEQYYTYFNKVKGALSFDKNINATNFLQDLEVSFCLIERDGNKLEFKNDTFKEYFVACQYLKATKEDFDFLANFLDKKRKSTSGDMMLEMLHEMNPTGVDDFMYLPFLERIFNEADADEEEGPFISFLTQLYPTISYSLETVNTELETVSSSFVYNNIRKAVGLTEYIKVDYGYQEDFVKEKYASGIGEFPFELVSMPGVHGYVFIDTVENVKQHFGLEQDPPISGYDIEFELRTLLNEKEAYEDLLNQITDENGPLYLEYIAIREYYEKLKQKKSEKPTGLEGIIFK